MTRTGRQVRVRRYPAGPIERADFDVVEVTNEQFVSIGGRRER